MVGFERTFYEFQRSEGIVSVCAVVLPPEDITEFDFLLLISIDEGGKEY